MDLTPYQIAVKREAEFWYQRDCREDHGSNRSACVDELKLAYGDKRPLDEAWCAQLGYVVHNSAAKSLRLRTIVPHTKGAKDMLLKAKKAGIRVDTVPQVGDVMYRFSDAGTGHIGIPVKVQEIPKKYTMNGKGIWVESGSVWTIEGNTSNRVGVRVYTPEDIANPKKGIQFIHVAEQYAGLLQQGNIYLRPFH